MSSDHKFVVSASCCGCSLRSGSLAIGITLLVLNLILAAMGIYAGVKGFTDGWIQMVTCGLTVILCAVLIHGIKTERRGMIMVWVWVMAVVCLINIIIGLIQIVLSANFIGGIIFLLIMGLYIYCIIVVRSYALSLGSPSNMA